MEKNVPTDPSMTLVDTESWNREISLEEEEEKKSYQNPTIKNTS